MYSNVYLKLGGQTQPHVVSRQHFARSLTSTYLTSSCLFLSSKVSGTSVWIGAQLQPAASAAHSEEVVEVIGPWMNFAIDAFGADRCMFEVRSRNVRRLVGTSFALVARTKSGA